MTDLSNVQYVKYPTLKKQWQSRNLNIKNSSGLTIPPQPENKIL